MRLRCHPFACVLAALALAAASSGCASTAKISQFSMFADAGEKYAKAMGELLDYSAKALVVLCERPRRSEARHQRNASLMADIRRDLEKQKSLLNLGVGALGKCLTSLKGVTKWADVVNKIIGVIGKAVPLLTGVGGPPKKI